MLTDEQKTKIKEFAATKPIQYDEAPTQQKLLNDCMDYTLHVFPEWNVEEATYFYEMVSSYTDVKQLMKA